MLGTLPTKDLNAPAGSPRGQVRAGQVVSREAERARQQMANDAMQHGRALDTGNDPCSPFIVLYGVVKLYGLEENCFKAVSVISNKLQMY